ncbi:MAG: DUF2865 domain-containing protein [Xanthobacteraceae bacterium]|nr:DUF2865 domain-containing protein [Xanthobacteraceae bacterium]
MLAVATLAGGLLSSAATAQTFAPGAAGGPGSPICMRLQGQLATIDQGQGDQGKADQIRRYQDAANKQQAELQRVQAQAQKQGCDSSGFFSLFTGRSAECGPINSRIQQMRENLDQITTGLQRLQAGAPADDPQRRSVILALAQNNCGPQYTNQARTGNFLTNLFGGGNAGDGAGGDPNASQSGTYRTVCVKSCDGSYFPISFATVPSRFADDEQKCHALCPNAQTTLYTYHNPGEDISQAVSISGQPYTQSPNAFRFRTQYDKTCGCRAPGQSWADALKNADDGSGAQNGDITVTDDKAKKLAQPSRLPAPSNTSATPADTSAAPASPATGNTGIRSVGPTFIPNNNR